MGRAHRTNEAKGHVLSTFVSWAMPRVPGQLVDRQVTSDVTPQELESHGVAVFRLDRNAETRSPSRRDCLWDVTDACHRRLSRTASTEASARSGSGANPHFSSSPITFVREAGHIQNVSLCSRSTTPSLRTQ